MEIWEIRLGEKEYPERLTQIQRPPELLYGCGRLPTADRKAVAIVGARGCSGYGRRMAEWFGSRLAAEGVTIISGMAEGIDGISQRAALAAGGDSTAVLGCGVDICYPAANRDLYRQLAGSGCLISEYAPGSRPEAWHFPQRNRIISGLADLVLVLEAREKSGSLITAEYALEQGKDVFALPGRVGDPLSAGCNRLIREGAGSALSPEDILFALFGGENRPGSCAAERTVEMAPGAAELLTETECFLLQYLDQDGTDVSRLLQLLEQEKNRREQAGNGWESKIPMEVPALMEILLSLCIKGVLKQENGRYFIAGRFLKTGGLEGAAQK